MHKTFKVVFAGLDVERDGFLLDIGIGANHHDVGRRSELVNKANELFVSQNHRLELVVRLNAT